MNKQKKLVKQNTPLYKRVPTLNLVDYSDIKVPLVVIYDSPKDFPGKSGGKSMERREESANECLLRI